ncbi:MAG: NAD(P)H-dependent oxidoreductase [Caulobacteraceae bacterium]
MPVATKVLVINGHPDSRGDRLCAALAAAYAEGAESGGLSVRRLAIGDLNIPILNRAADFSAPAPEGVIRQAQDDIAWADHVVIVHPLWLGGEPALLKAFLEQVLRYGFALDPDHKRLRGLLKGRSIRLIVTMGMPAIAYRLVFGGPGLKALLPAAFLTAGFWPIRVTLLGGVGSASVRRRAAWLRRVRRLGREGR